MDPINILVADDHSLFRSGMVSLLRPHKEIRVVGEATTGEQAVVLARQLQPDVVILDIAMPGCGGIEAARQIRQSLPETHVLMLTVSDSQSDLLAAIDAGARGYLLKSAVPEELVRALKEMAAGGSAICSTMTTKLIAELTASRRRSVAMPVSAPLTEREMQVLQLMGRGATNKQIARQLVITENTVKMHMQHILKKLNAKNRAEAAAHAAGSGLVGLRPNGAS